MKTTTAKKATAKKPTATKATAKKATATKATAKKSTATKATAKKATATKETAKKPTVSSLSKATTPSKLIDGRIKELGDWRGKLLSRLRTLIKKTDSDVVEEWKWRGVPVWEHDGMICTGETYKDYVKLTFAKGAALKDPSRLFNSSLEGNVRRAIDFHEDDKVDEKAFVALVRAAVALNQSTKKPKGSKTRG
jgi:hypothetical protein